MGDVKTAQNMVKELKKLSEASLSEETRQRSKTAVREFKKVLSQFKHLPPSTKKDKSSKSERTVAMQGYEYACILSANRMLDDDAMEVGSGEAKNRALERHVLLLRPFYFDYRKELGDSSKRSEVLGLELLSLLVGQELGDYYSLLERIPLEEKSDKYISYVVSLEEFLMEGSYNQLLLARKKCPSKHYKTLLEELEITVRNEVASCIEQAYETISMDAAAKLMNCKKDTLQAIAMQRENWTVQSNGTILLRHVEQKKAEVPTGITKDLIKETLGYAHQLERIV